MGITGAAASPSSPPAVWGAAKWFPTPISTSCSCTTTCPREEVARVAELLWYPLWDANIRLDHSVRTVSEAPGRRCRHLSRSGDAGSPSHRRRRILGPVDRRGPAAVAGRDRLAVRRTRRPDPVALAAQRSDRPSRRARSEVREWAGCATSSCSTRWRSPNSPTSIPGSPRTRRPGRWVRRTWRCSTCAPNCTGCPNAAAISCSPSTPTRSVPHCASATG